jgi:hypothetical protein
LSKNENYVEEYLKRGFFTIFLPSPAFFGEVGAVKRSRPSPLKNNAV